MGIEAEVNLTPRCALDRIALIDGAAWVTLFRSSQSTVAVRNRAGFIVCGASGTVPTCMLLSLTDAVREWMSCPWDVEGADSVKSDFVAVYE